VARESAFAAKVDSTRQMNTDESTTAIRKVGTFRPAATQQNHQKKTPLCFSSILLENITPNERRYLTNSENFSSLSFYVTADRALNNQTHYVQQIPLMMLYPSSVAALIMAALRSRCGHYIFALRLLSFIFFPRLI